MQQILRPSRPRHAGRPHGRSCLGRRPPIPPIRPAPPTRLATSSATQAPSMNARNSLTPVGAGVPYHYEPGVGAVWTDAWKLYGGEVPPPAPGRRHRLPAVGCSSVSEGQCGPGGDPERPGHGARQGGIPGRWHPGRHGQRPPLERQLVCRRCGQSRPQRHGHWIKTARC